MIPEHTEIPAGIVQRSGLPGPVAGGTEQVQGLLGMIDGLTVPGLHPEQAPELDMTPRQTDRIVHFFEQLECLAKLNAGVGVRSPA